MRLLLVLVVTCLLSGCAAGGPGGARAFLDGSASTRAARAELDAQAIQQGMEQARSSDQRMARILVPVGPAAKPDAVTR
jgi:hypothetical protein